MTEHAYTHTHTPPHTHTHIRALFLGAKLRVFKAPLTLWEQSVHCLSGDHIATLGENPELLAHLSALRLSRTFLGSPFNPQGPRLDQLPPGAPW